MAKLSVGSVAVIGAGISGVVSAAHLLAVGLNVTVFERNKAAGGVWYVFLGELVALETRCQPVIVGCTINDSQLNLYIRPRSHQKENCQEKTLEGTSGVFSSMHRQGELQYFSF